MNYPSELLNKTPLQGAVINVTDNCNLNCRYCFTEQNPKTMELDIGIQALNWLINQNEQKEIEYPIDLHIGFFGGEPTLRWDEFIVPLINYYETYLRNKYSKKYTMSFGMTTNGQLLNEERIKWFKEHNGNFLLSIDGDRETQEYNRPRKDGLSSFDELEPIIDLLLKYQPDITFRSTITPAMCHNLHKDYLYARKKGFKNYFSIPNFREEWDKEHLQILNEQICLICGTLLFDIENNNQPLGFNLLNQMINYCFNPAPQKQHFRKCGFGTTSIGITTDGKLSACQENSTYHNNNIFYIGDIWKGIDQNKQLKLLEQYNETKVYSNNCKNCEISNICQFLTCPSTNYAMTGEILKRPEANCEWLKILYFNSANLVLNAAQHNSKNFIQYLKETSEYAQGKEEF